MGYVAARGPPTFPNFVAAATPKKHIRTYAHNIGTGSEAAVSGNQSLRRRWMRWAPQTSRRHRDAMSSTLARRDGQTPIEPLGDESCSRNAYTWSGPRKTWPMVLRKCPRARKKCQTLSTTQLPNCPKDSGPDSRLDGYLLETPDPKPS
jgi:hypothetical protein